MSLDWGCIATDIAKVHGIEYVMAEEMRKEIDASILISLVRQEFKVLMDALDMLETPDLIKHLHIIKTGKDYFAVANSAAFVRALLKDNMLLDCDIFTIKLLGK